jgi:hypothetical protein
MKNKADQLDDLYQHPGAIGVRPSGDSPFVTSTASGISTTSVLLDSGISTVAALPRVKTEDRPKVYCPFCGRRGKYSKNRDPKLTRLEFFSHLSGDERCVDSYLDNIQHQRAISWITAQLEIHRLNNWRIQGYLSCKRCKSPVLYTMLNDGFDKVGVEESFRNDQVNRRPDIVVFKEGKPLLAIEVALSSYIDEIRRKDLESFGVPGIEIKCKDIFNRLGVPRWEAGEALPQASVHWQIESSAGRLSICERCRQLSPDQEAINDLIKAGALSNKMTWQRAVLWSQTKLGESYKPDPDKGPLHDLIAAPERISEADYRRRNDALHKKPAELCNSRQLAHAIFGLSQFGWLDNLDLAIMLKTPFGEMSTIIVEQFVKTARMDSNQSITQYLDEFEEKYLPLLREIQEHWTTEATRSEIATIASLIALRNFYAKGSTAFQLEDLVAAVQARLRLNCSESIHAAIVEDKAFTQGPGNGYWALSSWASAERVIAKVLVKWGRTSKLYRQNTLPIDLPPDQMEALRAVLGSRAAIITGGAGTGKTTLVKYMLEQSELYWHLLAPTHRAVANMRAKIEQSHERACRIKSIQTLEAFLVAHDNPQSKKNYTYDNFGFVVDEASMIDSFQMARLLDAVQHAGRLVLVGDANQLPSIGPGRVLEDLITSGALPTGLLTTLRRSGAGSTITALAGEIAQGRVPGKRIGGEVSFIRCSEGKLVEEVTQRFLAKNGHLTKHVQIISPYNKLNNDINKSIRQAIHGRVESDYLPGDRLICMKTLKTKDRTSIHNGEFATFIRAVKSGGFIKADDGTSCEIYLSWEKLRSFSLGWAATVHKAQGTEWPHIIVVVPKEDNSEFVDRSLIYTAITRAQRSLMVIGDSQAVISAAKQRSVDRRKTLLGAFIKEALKSTHP